MSDEFSIDIDKALQSAKDNDLAGGFVDYYPSPVESVKKAVENCIDLAGLDKKVMGDIAMGEYTSYDCYDSTGRNTKKIVIEYEEPKTR
tara:strand:- start:1184 stop:1450 length:267 start_codon:yes stop_codon:yes gene_type:complete